jgi:hypothetical protein
MDGRRTRFWGAAGLPADGRLPNEALLAQPPEEIEGLGVLAVRVDCDELQSGNDAQEVHREGGGDSAA